MREAVMRAQAAGQMLPPGYMPEPQGSPGVIAPPIVSPAAGADTGGDDDAPPPGAKTNKRPNAKKSKQETKRKKVAKDEPSAAALEDTAIETPKPTIALPGKLVSKVLGGGEATGPGGHMPVVAPQDDVPIQDKFKSNDSLCARMRRRDIHDHTRSLLVDFNACHTPDNIRDLCKPLLTTLYSMPYIEWFSTPVDKVKLGIPDYDDIIKRRMDLGTVKKYLGAW